MILPAPLLEVLQLALWDYTGQTVTITGAEQVSGGCINRCARLQTPLGSWFVKWNDASLFPGMMQAEESGLRLLRQSDSLPVPETLLSGEVAGISFLLMEFVASGVAVEDTFSQFGSQLAALHRSTTAFYGLENDNYIGSLLQSNRPSDTWGAFFATQRIEPMLMRARDAGYISRALVQQVERMLMRWDELVPFARPSLLHGDLWSGNYRLGQEGSAWLIDPAVYYGHREMDIAMTQLFGGFPKAFYEGYLSAWPLEPGWQQRVSYHNLYPLLVHVNLFGESYVGEVMEVVRGF